MFWYGVMQGKGKTIITRLEKDFVKFYNSPRTLFAKDMNNIK